MVFVDGKIYCRWFCHIFFFILSTFTASCDCDIERRPMIAAGCRRHQQTPANQNQNLSLCVFFRCRFRCCCWRISDDIKLLIEWAFYVYSRELFSHVMWRSFTLAHSSASAAMNFIFTGFMKLARPNQCIRSIFAKFTRHMYVWARYLFANTVFTNRAHQTNMVQMCWLQMSMPTAGCM